MEPRTARPGTDGDALFRPEPALAGAPPAADRAVRDSGLRIGGWVAVGLWLSVSLVFTSATLQQGQDPDVWLPVFVTVGITGTVLSLPVLYVGAATSGSGVKGRFLWISVTALVAACAQSATDVAVHTAIQAAVHPDHPAPSWPAAFSFNMMLYIWIYALYGTAVALVFALLGAKGAERRLLQLQSSADRARLEALKLQINPHFLFNALNAAVSLIGLDRSADAEAVLLRLSNLFRSSLVSPSGDVVSLADEFEIIEAYLEIESIRFGERLSVAIELPENLRNAAWPHFLLQPLVENAIKHGTACTNLPTHVRVRAAGEGDRLVVTVENDPTLETTNPGRGVGLSNTRERLAVQFGGDAGVETSLRDGVFVARIHLPLAFMPGVPAG